MTDVLEAKYIVRGNPKTEDIQAFARNVLHMSEDRVALIKPGHEVNDYGYQGNWTADQEPPFQSVQISWPLKSK